MSGWLQRRPLTVIKSNYVTIYAVDGALLPFMSLFLATEHGLSAAEIGIVFAVAGAAAVLSPSPVTFLADAYFRADRLLLALLLLSAVILVGLTFSSGFVWILVLYLAFNVVREPVRPLLDGVFFATQRAVPGIAQVSYHKVRIWGTFGFMVPGVLLFFLLDQQGSMGRLPLLAAGLAIVGLVVTFWLPATEPAHERGEGLLTSMRTLGRAAGELLKRPDTAWFMVAMFLLQVSIAAYSTYYPLLATEEAGIPARWLGLVVNLGVLIELAYMAAFGVLVKWLGWRWLMVVGCAVGALRLVLLAAVPTAGVVVGTQIVHGAVIVCSMVAARVILDRRAPDKIRHTTQGLYSMLVMGSGRIVGSLFGGLGSDHLGPIFWAAAGASGLAALILALSLRGEDEAAKAALAESERGG
ncbi:MFS transporter [Tenggerimyces flavus]|uniref:MFS transporter n=1 Tax=Tenggerimyces flavus TaxID=1708749 RepID=A0ABV7YEJ8_9ACTN|nr:MFS transporter [Tenggerimyces flavus]MBM7788921.1 PPP family 3-phenylpropionic acid transporter [Tenggerimyces flavus]